MLALAFPPGAVVGVATLAALELTGVVKLLAIAIGLLSGVGTVVGIIYGVRYKIVYEVEKKAREGAQELAALEEKRGDRLEAELLHAATRIDDAVKELVDAHDTIARLENIPNVEAVVKLMADTAERADKRSEERLANGVIEISRLAAEHEERALERHDSMISVMAGLAANIERLNRRLDTA